MKILTRNEFMKLPEGVIFCKGQPWYFEPLTVKGDTIEHNGKNIDFTCRQLCWIEANSSEAASDALDAMLEDGASHPLCEGYGRDGCFDEDDIFLIYEKADLENMIDLFKSALGE